MVLKKTELKNVPIASVTPSPDNPRQNSEGVPKVVESLKEFGYIKTSIGVDENNVLLYGHTTLKAFHVIARLPAEERGMLVDPLHVPEVTMIEGLTDDQKKAYRIVDNRASEFSTWDVQLLVDELKALEDNGFAIEKIGFTESDFNEFLDQIDEAQFVPTFTGDTPPGADDGDDNSFVPAGAPTEKTFQNHCPRCGFDYDTVVTTKPVNLKDRL